MSVRLRFLDSLRGFAMVLMAIYHFCFDLNHFGLLPGEFSAGIWPWFRAVIVSLFVFLVGSGLYLGQASYRSPTFLERLLVLFCCAAAMSGFTFILFPGAWVSFGILQFIFVACLLGPFLIQTPRLCLPLGVALMALPALAHLPYPPVLGLSLVKPITVDFVPFCPWLGVVMLGIFFAWLTQKRVFALLSWELKPLSFLGRHSLLFYMTHQMLLFPLAWLLAHI